MIQQTLKVTEHIKLNRYKKAEAIRKRKMLHHLKQNKINKIKPIKLSHLIQWHASKVFLWFSQNRNVEYIKLSEGILRVRHVLN